MATRETIIKINLENQDAIRQLGKWEAELLSVRQETRELNKAIKEQGGATAEQERQLGILRSTAKNLSGNIRELSNETSGLTAAGMRFRDKMAGAFKQSLTALGGQFLTVTGAVLGLKQVFDNVVGIIADFDKAQSKLAGILGTTKEGMAELTDQAKLLGSTTAFTASQVSDAQTELAKLGFTQNEILAATPALLDLARGAGSDIAQAAEIAAGTLNAFGLGAEETTRLADVMAKSFSSTALDIDKFSFAMRVVGPVAKNAGLSIEETTALIGVLADNNIRAETSGTGLRNILGKLAQTGMTFEEAMRLINTSTDKTKTAIDLFGLEASTVAIVLADNTTKTGELTVAFDKAAGSAKDLADAMDDNLIGDKLKLTSAWEGFVLSVDSGSGVISKTLRGITTAFADILGYITILNASDPFMATGDGKGSVARAEKALSLYRSELEKVIEAEAAEVGWKDASLAATLALNKVNDAELQNMRERSSVMLGRIKTAEDVANTEARLLSIIEKAEPLSAKWAEAQALLNAVRQKGKQIAEANNAVVADETKKTGDATDATDKNTEAVRAQRQEVQGLTKGMRDLIQAYDDLQKGTVRVMPIIQPQVGGAPLPGVPVGSGDAMIANPENFPGTAIVNDMKENAGELETLTIDYANLFMQMSTAIGGSLADAFSGVEDANKKILISILEMVRNASRMYIAMAMAREIGTKGFIGIGTGVALSVAIEALIAAAINSVQGFAQGGMVRQSDGPRYTRNPGDSVLISAAPGEVVMTREQQRRANMLAGFNVFAAAKVPGFAAGGTVWVRGYDHGRSMMMMDSVRTPRPSPSDLSGIENAARMQAQPIFVKVQEINDVQGRVARVTERATL